MSNDTVNRNKTVRQFKNATEKYQILRAIFFSV